VTDRYSRTRLRMGGGKPPRPVSTPPADVAQEAVTLPEQAFLLEGLAGTRPPEQPARHDASRGTGSESPPR